MAIEILMPALSPTMTEGNLAKWFKQEGDSVKPGDILAEIETDKATMEIEAIDHGILGKILISDQTTNVKVNQLIGVLLEQNDDQTHMAKIINKYDTLKVSEVLENKSLDFAQNNSISNHSNLKRVFISPLAKRIAERKLVDINHITGSGPRGRITKKDILNFKNLPSIEKEADIPHVQMLTKIPISNMRRVIADRLLKSKQSIPHFYLDIDCEVDSVLQLKDTINQINKENRISVNDIIIKATSVALRQLPQMNVSFNDDFIIQYSDIDVSIAVGIENGLITPIIRCADVKSITDISIEVKKLAQKARNNQLKSEEYQGGNFSITNLGMYGIKNFQAIINPPQSAILAVGAIFKKPVVKQEEIKIVNIMTVSLSCDHRVIDGILGAKFLNKFKEYMENPSLMLF